ncbi:MAG: peptidoglycan DD-metalloendopeptidase family protein [Syntrophomonadaceae bacterium]|nr:peptidoglycan DD-metalloendopeptidase family protein [Syntrophomonadaceae bacterium]MDD3889444.1 peptidoglycan DD-metalloendopeptidase family protein [Syntrophomonadaceae bacterium]MDD4550266.1 peptidoglycan DD-metalloendopeptidase family protein [Syntrophomonadaceae bacterium]
MEWLFSGQVDSFYITEGFIPVELYEYFEKVGEIFNIPAWFLAAVAYQESSFNPEALNSSGACGLFQLMPHTQKSKVDRLISEYSQYLPQNIINLYHDTLNKDEDFYQQIVRDPYINTLCGALDLKDKGLSENWDSDWQKQALPALARYGGYVEIPKKLWKKYNISSEEEARRKVQEWAKDDYAEKIFRHAERFKVERCWPVDNYPITAYFGQTGSNWANGHSGIDIGTPVGTPVYSVANGKVVLAGWNGVYGKCIIIDNGWYKFYYGHLSEFYVKKDDCITIGKAIGQTGNTGRATGPHLHFEIPNANNIPIDPLTWLK